MSRNSKVLKVVIERLLWNGKIEQKYTVERLFLFVLLLPWQQDMRWYDHHDNECK